MVVIIRIRKKVHASKLASEQAKSMHLEKLAYATKAMQIEPGIQTIGNE